MTTSPTTDANDSADDFELTPPDKLYAHHRRQLSAMMDGELSPDEAKFMLRRLEHDSGLAGCWERWQVCGDVLRGRRNMLLPADFPQRVAHAMKDRDGEVDAVATVSMPQARPRFARWMGGGALAASVAVVALLVARQMPGDVGPANPEAPAGIVAQTPAAPAPVEEQMPSSAASNLAAATLAATVAAAEAPRRAAGRRAVTRNSLAQNQRAANRVQARNAVEQPTVVAATGLPAIASVPTSASSESTPAVDLFATRPLAPDIAPARPWPRAILPSYSASDAFSAGYGNRGGGIASGSFDPFQPRLQAEPVTSPSPDADDDGEDEDAVDAVPH